MASDATNEAIYPITPLMILKPLELAIYSYNSLAVIGLCVFVIWGLSFVFRIRGLLKERRMILQGRVLEVDDPTDHPEWLERSYITRLANRQVREVPAIPIESQEAPFLLLELTGDAADPFTASASATFLARGAGSICWMFGVRRDFWQQLKRKGGRASLEPLTHCVRGSQWCDFKLVAPDEPVEAAAADVELFAGSASPTVDGVALLLLLRRGSQLMAFTGASDGRLLESVVWDEHDEALSLRDVFSETDPDCLVCCAEPRNTILLPCRHDCCCTTCLSRMDKCPVCRAPVESFVAFGNDDRHIVAAREDETLTQEDRELIDELQAM